MLSLAELERVLDPLPRIKVEARLVRAVRQDILDDPTAQVLYPKASTLNDGQRYTLPGGAPSIYLAYEYNTAVTEVGAQVWNEERRQWENRANYIWALAAVETSVSDVLDLTNPAILRALNTTPKELKSAWRFVPGLAPGELPLTHQLARAAIDASSLYGFKYASAKDPTGTCLVIFYEPMCAVVGNRLQVLAHNRLRQVMGHGIDPAKESSP